MAATLPKQLVFKAASETGPVSITVSNRVGFTQEIRRLAGGDLAGVVVWWNSVPAWSVQYSADMLTWTTLTSGRSLNTNDPIVIVEVGGPAISKRFYRIVPGP